LKESENEIISANVEEISGDAEVSAFKTLKP